MKEFTRGFAGTILDLRVIVGVCGVIVSVLMHELFHAVIHWGEIEGVHILPSSTTMVDILFVPSNPYDIAVEEAFAYTITTVTLLLTVMLITDINDTYSEKSKEPISFVSDFGLHHLGQDDPKALEHLATILGINVVTQEAPILSKK